MRFFLLASFLVLGACGTTQLPLTYVATVTPAADARPVVDVAEVALSRRTGREEPLWVGTIRGGYGNPLKALHADRPVNEVVRQALRDGLRARGLLVASGVAPRRRLVVDLTQFDANQYVRREATVAMAVSVEDAGGGPPRWRDTVLVHQVDGSIFGGAGVFGSVDDLHALMQRVLQQAVDQTLDNPGFRAAIAD